MKNLSFILVAILLSISSSAQFNKGRILAGGSAGYNSTTSKSKFGSNSANTIAKSSEFSLTPQVGYIIIDNLAIGAGLDFSFISSKPEADIYDEMSTRLLFQPFVRYYIEPGIFFQGALGLGSQKDKQSYQGTSQEQKYAATNWSLAVGYALFLNDRVALEPMIGYRNSNLKVKDSDTKYLDSGLFLKIGLQVYLRD